MRQQGNCSRLNWRMTWRRIWGVVQNKVGSVATRTRRKNSASKRILVISSINTIHKKIGKWSDRLNIHSFLQNEARRKSRAEAVAFVLKKAMLRTKNKLLKSQSNHFWCPAEHKIVFRFSFCIYAQLLSLTFEYSSLTKNLILSIQRKCFDTVTVFAFSQNSVVESCRLAPFAQIEATDRKSVV